MRAHEERLDYVLRSYTCEIPDFQRPFSWKEEQLGEFWDDLKALTSEERGTHFMGTVVLQMREGQTSLVWDGQQRLAAILIFLATARDYLLREGSEESRRLAHDLQRDYVVRGGMLAAEHPTALTLGDLDQPTFEALILRALGDEGKRTLEFFSGLSRRLLRREWSPLIVDAYSYFLELIEAFVSQLAQQDREWQSGILSLLRVLLQRFEIIVAETGDTNDAFATFQVLNDRGLGLSAADLLKNFFLSETAENERGDAAAAWDEMAQLVGGESLPTYLRHFYMSRYGLVSRPRLYKTLVSTTREDAQGHRLVTSADLLADVAQFGPWYRRLTKPSSEHDAWTDAALRESLEMLEGLGATQWSPLALAGLMCGISEAELAPLILLSETLVVREIVVRGRNPNAFERVFSGAAQQVWRLVKQEGQDLRAGLAEAWTTLAAEFSNEDLFAAAFSELSVGSRRARTMLDALERQLQRDTLGGVRPEHQVLDVEHIYPQTDRVGWPREDDPGYVPPNERDRLGNLTLLHLVANRSQKNAPFVEKQERYRASNILLTRGLGEAQLREWGADQIVARQEQLLEIARRRWPIPERHVYGDF